MKRSFYILTLAIIFLFFGTSAHANEPASAHLFAYTKKDNGRAGLLFAWSIDKKNWHQIGNEYPFVKSDYGSWWGGKNMENPTLTQTPDGFWHSLWTLNTDDPTFAYAKSEDLITWEPQIYPVLDYNNICKNLNATYNSGDESFSVSWMGDKNGKVTFYTANTKDFRTFSPISEISKSQISEKRETISITGKPETGTILQVKWSVIDNLIKNAQLVNFQNQQNQETMNVVAPRFSEIKSLKANIKANKESKAISDDLIGIFFEDINYAADGGLYGELIQNRDFEYNSSDNRDWSNKTAWTLKGEGSTFEISTENPLHENNPHHAILKTEKVGASLLNDGYKGIALKKNEKYDFSIYTRATDSNCSKLIIRLIDKDGYVCGETKIAKPSKNWKQNKAVITATKTVADAHLEIIMETSGEIAIDMVSLFPQKTFNGRKNGLRADLAQTLADLKPQFVRFPGGCVAHGDGIENIYNWKHTIGSLESRKPQHNLWGYHQSFGLGYYEYFQFCEDIGAKPLPVVAAGVPCQNSGKHNHKIAGQQDGIPMDEMDAYIQDILDLIDWANGDPKTNKWAKMRAEAGHPAPFNLKYLGVGNEDLISVVFEERFKMIYDAIKEKHPEIVVIGTVGPFSEGSDYVRGWDFATEQKVPIVDEHYYQPPGWFINNQEYYDKYDRNKSKVYLGEYAAHVSGRHNNIETALLEALHLINIERNADVVTMTSYAPLIAKEGNTQWNPDLIYFNNTEVKPTVGYYVQQLFGQNAGDEYIYSTIQLSENNTEVNKRVGKSIVRDSKTGDIIIKLANLLPIEVELNLDLAELGIDQQTAPATILTGTPDDKVAKPTKTTFNLKSDKLKPYSFTVIRIKGNK